jgi:hypothetical protein
MAKRYGIIFFLLGFLFFSFSGSICQMSKLRAQQVAELLGNISEEEDETEKEDGSDSEMLVAMFENITSFHIQLEQHFFSHAVIPLPLFNPNTLIQPPEA